MNDLREGQYSTTPFSVGGMRMRDESRVTVKKKRSVRFKEIVEDYSDYELDEKGNQIKIRRQRMTRVPVETSDS